ncbi:hypothetical protein P43SY_004288 [Pythium insidiosum]|uniref:Alternative oxidase n=1 Tax=Pythium insidiosum TaxID=114742 RepID=A0AAD5Q3Q9_PYTIN|nr:hypothetical protein P43SY_004288 [Pythium insidiosum]
MPTRPFSSSQTAKDVTEEAPMIAHFTQSSTRHPLTPPDASKDTPQEPTWDNPVPHAVYDLDKITVMPQTHHDVKKMHERVAYLAVKALRGGFDIMSGYRGPGGQMTEKDWLHRCLFLETVAGVPGMVAGMVRHLRSLRSMQAENERMHLLIFMNMKQPGPFFRLLVLGAQGVFFNMFFLSYLVAPRTCHRFVGYLEEEAVKTYTGLLKDIEDGHLPEWRDKEAPLIARSYYKLPTEAKVYDMIKSYYKLPTEAKVYDMIKCIRADEANHRDVNHTFAGLDQVKGVNPFLMKPHK